jgi:hypothetical protein
VPSTGARRRPPPVTAWHLTAGRSPAARRKAPTRRRHSGGGGSTTPDRRTARTSPPDSSALVLSTPPAGCITGRLRDPSSARTHRCDRTGGHAPSHCDHGTPRTRSPLLRLLRRSPTWSVDGTPTAVAVLHRCSVAVDRAAPNAPATQFFVPTRRLPYHAGRNRPSEPTLSCPALAVDRPDGEPAGRPPGPLSAS